MKRVALALIIVVAVAGVAVALIGRSLLTGERVRAALAAQVSSALGQPVTIEGLTASIYPRVTVDLTGVGIGAPPGIRLQSMQFVTNLGALFSRRIEHAGVRIDGAQITLPLPAFRAVAAGAPTNQEASGRPTVEIVSVDEISLRNVAIVRGDRTVKGDVELVPRGNGVDLRRVALTADEAAIEVTGTLTSLNPLEGTLDARAERVNFDRLMQFMSDFVATDPRGTTTGNASAAAGRVTVNLAIANATTGSLALSDVKARATVTPAALTLESLGFGVFEGRYEGALQLAMQTPPHFTWRGDVSRVNVSALMAFAGAPASVTGTLNAAIVLEGTGVEMEQALRTARGTAVVRITDGTVAGLSLVPTLVVATSGRGGYAASAQRAMDSHATAKHDERFSTLAASLSVANGIVRIPDLALSSSDVDLTAAGTLTLANLTTNLAGRARLSETLSKQAGTDLYRYAQEGGRVTLPATVKGPLGNLTVGIDIANAAQRAIRNRLNEEATKAIERNLPPELKGLFPKRPPR
jgi:uncharacterized protein involved in outer membrane biogenesis